MNLVLDQAEIRELLVEGGSTAFAIIQKLGFASFIKTINETTGQISAASQTLPPAERGQSPALHQEHLQLPLSQRRQ